MPDRFKRTEQEVSKEIADAWFTPVVDAEVQPGSFLEHIFRKVRVRLPCPKIAMRFLGLLALVGLGFAFSSGLTVGIVCLLVAAILMLSLLPFQENETSKA